MTGDDFDFLTGRAATNRSKQSSGAFVVVVDGVDDVGLKSSQLLRLIGFTVGNTFKQPFGSCLADRGFADELFAVKLGSFPALELASLPPGS